MTLARASLVVLGIALGAILAACGPNQPPSAPVHRSRAPANAEAVQAGDDDEALTDADGDVEAWSAPVEETGAPVEEARSPCPPNMVLVDAEDETRFCIDKYEASLVELDSEGTEKPFPHWLAVDGHTVRAVSLPDVFPQAFISEIQAEDACAASGKRLCSYREWKTACMGPAKTTFPYGEARRPGVCHDTGKSAVAAVFGMRALTDPVASASPSKPIQVARSKAANASRSRGSKSATGSSRIRTSKPPAAKSTKPARQAHVTTKGRAAETTKQRPARSRSVAEKTDKRASAGKTSKHRAERMDRATERDKKRRLAAAKASIRPASVEASVWTQLNDPRLGQVDGALAKTGSHEECVNGYGAVDMVGNLHEWVKTEASAVHGTFAGGYYLDTTLNGDGCRYRTVAHAHDYHDYSTGFRCCAEANAPEATPHEQE